jgi:hypothetical protein
MILSRFCNLASHNKVLVILGDLGDFWNPTKETKKLLNPQNMNTSQAVESYSYR